jgi:hypothetical protein
VVVNLLGTLRELINPAKVGKNYEENAGVDFAVGS